MEPRQDPTSDRPDIHLVEITAAPTEAPPLRPAALAGAFAAAVAVTAFLSFGLPRLVDVEPTFVRAAFYAELVKLALIAHVAQRLGWRPSRVPLWSVGLAAVAIVVAVTLWLGVGPQFRVLADETNLLGMSLSLYLERTYRNITEGFWYYDSFHTVSSAVDQRPPLFPVLLTLVHAVVGFRGINALAVNALLGGATIAAFIAFGKRRTSVAHGALASLVLLGMPVFGITATSGGFETMNHLVVMLALWAGVELYLRPDALRLELALLLATASASLRYESALVVAPIGLAAALRWRRLAFDRGALRLLLIPFLYVTLNWQRLLTRVTNGNDTPANGTFSLTNVPANARALADFFFDPQRQGFPTSTVVVTLAILGAVLVVRRLARARDRDTLVGLGLAAAAYALIAAVHLTFYLGDLRLAFQQRIALVYVGPIALLAAVPLTRLLGRPEGRVAAWAIAATLAVHGLTQAALDPFGRSLTLTREYRAVLELLDHQDRRGTLIISERPNLYAAQQWGAIGYGTLHAKLDSLRVNLQRRLYTNVLAIQRVVTENVPQPVASPPLPPGFKVTTVLEFQNEAAGSVRVSRLELEEAH